MKLVELDVPLNIDPGGTMPEVKSDEHNLEISFYLLGSNMRGVLKFNHFLQYTFGYPNEEAIAGHRYASLGLSPFRFVEVINSEVVESIKATNKVHPYHSDKDFESFKHFIYPFHDTTIEVIAKSYEFVL